LFFSSGSKEKVSYSPSFLHFRNKFLLIYGLVMGMLGFRVLALIE